MPENNTTIEDLLSKIDALESKMGELESNNKKLESANDEIRAFNRKLLERKVEKPIAPNNNEEALAKLDKYLKGE